MNKDYKKSFKENFDRLSMKYGKNTVFLDFVKMCAISLYNAFAKDKEMEERYLNTINSYEKKDQNLFTKMFGNLIMMYQTANDIIDILGPIYEHEKLANAHIGQFFTPSHIAKLMSEILINDDKENLLVVANDISEFCVYMTYIQLALYGIPAIVYCGNALTNEINFKMETPLYFLQYWKFINAFIEDSENRMNSNQNKIIVDETIQNKFKEVMVKGNYQISLF